MKATTWARFTAHSLMGVLAIAALAGCGAGAGGFVPPPDIVSPSTNTSEQRRSSASTGGLSDNPFEPNPFELKDRDQEPKLEVEELPDLEFTPAVPELQR